MDIPPLLVDTFERLDQPSRAMFGRRLRSAGLSYGEIERLTGTPKSTVATWCGDIELTDRQRAAIRSRTGSRKGEPRDTQRKRRLQIEKIRAQARRRADDLIDDPFWVAGVALYWAEGAKTQRRLEMSNSDPAVLRVMKAWVLRYIDPDAVFSISLHLHSSTDPEAAQRYWGEELDIPHERFYKPYTKPDSGHHRTNHLPHGICMLRMNASADAWFIAMEWVEVVRSRFGHTPPLVTSHTGR